MKILILNEIHDYSLGSSYSRAFRQLGHQVTQVDPFCELRKIKLWRFRLARRLFERQIIAAFNRKWIQGLVETPADIVWAGKGAWAVPWLWKEFKKRKPKSKLVCYNADNPIVTYSRGGNRPWVTEAIPCFDLYCTYNDSLIEALRSAGARQAVRIPFAWDPWLHPEMELSPEDYRHYACDAVFVGNGDAYREKWMGDIIQDANGRNWQIRIYGDWSRCRDRTVMQAVCDAQLYGREMVKAIRSAKICINILRIQNEGSHNMRTFEIPGCGGLMASQYSPEQNEFFPDDEEAIYFKSATEAVEKMSALISQPERLATMRKRAHERAHSNTYVHRARAMMDALESLSIQL